MTSINIVNSICSSGLCTSCLLNYYSSLEFIKLSDVIFGQIENYMKNTLAKTHSSYAVDIVQVFRASRNGETERFQKVKCKVS